MPAVMQALRRALRISFVDMFKAMNSHDTSAAHGFFISMKSAHALAIPIDWFHLPGQWIRSLYEHVMMLDGLT
ncbi:MAG: hypothetical protein ACREE5_09675 [Acetobacteraceae bacterium]